MKEVLYGKTVVSKTIKYGFFLFDGVAREEYGRMPKKKEEEAF